MEFLSGESADFAKSTIERNKVFGPETSINYEPGVESNHQDSSTQRIVQGGLASHNYSNTPMMNRGSLPAMHSSNQVEDYSHVPQMSVNYYSSEQPQPYRMSYPETNVMQRMNLPLNHGDSGYPLSQPLYHSSLPGFPQNPYNIQTMHSGSMHLPMDSNNYDRSLNPRSKQLKLFMIPEDATNCLYVDGVPFDATEREVSHVFRPFPGYIQSRLIPKTTKTGRKYFFCFVDFEDKAQATIAMQTLQDYRFYWKDPKGLKLCYANPTNQIKRGRVGDGQDDRSEGFRQRRRDSID